MQRHAGRGGERSRDSWRESRKGGVSESEWPRASPRVGRRVGTGEPAASHQLVPRLERAAEPRGR